MSWVVANFGSITALHLYIPSDGGRRWMQVLWCFRHNLVLPVTGVTRSRELRKKVLKECKAPQHSLSRLQNGELQQPGLHDL